MALLQKVNLFVINFTNWKDLFGIDDDDVNLPNVDKSGEEIKSDIQNFFLIAFSGLVVLFIGVILYGGFTWITAGDNEEKLRKAKNIMKSGLIALILTFGFLILLAVIGYFLGIKIDTSATFLDDIL